MSSVCSRYQRWLRPALVGGYIILLMIVIPLVILHLIREKAQKHVVAWFVAGIFVLATLPISLWDIAQHLVHYNRPELQRYYIRIIWMVPIYSLDSWLGLRFPNAAVYFDIPRECYEAYVIYNFIQLLLTYLQQQEHKDATALQSIFHKHMFPVKYFIKPWPAGERFVRLCTLGTLQYAVVRLVTTIIAVFCAIGDRYKEGKIGANNAWVYLVVVNNISQFWAMYCLVLFYYAAKEPLKGLKPFPKFLCIKLVVFFSFWQSVVIAIIGKLGGIPEKETWTSYNKETVESSIQDFSICVEMFVAAIAHHYSFSYTPFVDFAANTPTCWQNVIQMLNVSDISDDIVSHTREIVQQRRSKKPKGRDDKLSESTGLLEQSSQPDYDSSRLANGADRTSLLSGEPVRSNASLVVGTSSSADGNTVSESSDIVTGTVRAHTTTSENT